MSIHIKLIKNKPVDSNCYVISRDEDKNCIIIDPGDKEGEQLIGYLNGGGFIPVFIIVTHEHFDHIWAINKLKGIFKVNLICSQYCSEKIISSKGNLSVFYDQVGFSAFPADILVEEINYTLKWDDHLIKFISTPGHTGGCICVEIENNLFTGDFMIKGAKTNTKFPGGDAAILHSSFSSMKLLYQDKNIQVFPGHGEPFYFHELQ
ncbi:MAG: MBL fold metallo-hydrolase [Bacteroidales bacterium]|nr:MBL fold metallo-hydrolase [Bacteroidales bacterium]